MYIYYDKNYNLKEFITDVKAFQSASEVNNLYVYVEDLEDDDYTNATVRYKNYGTIDEKDKQINVSNEFNFDGTEEKEIPFNREQDLLYFKYGKTYKFIKFVIPDEILAENGVVLATIRLITDKTIQPLELLTFNVYNEVVAKDVGITLSQWNYLLKRLYISGKFIKVVQDIGILNNNFEDYNDRDVIFDEAGQNFYLILEINGVKTKELLLTRSSENSVNTIIVRNDKGKAEIETPVKNEDGSKSIVNVEYVNKVVEDLTLRSDVVDIVGTYQELESYDTSKLTVNDVIKVLQDNTHDNASTYYKWNGTSFDFIGEEGPYYTQTEVDAKLDNKVNKIEKATNWQVYGVGSKSIDLPNGDSIDVSDQAFPNTMMNRDWRGTSKIKNPVEDLDIANKAYIDGRMDYVVLSKTQFILNSALDEDDRQLLLDFYNKNYEKSNILLFAIDKNGNVASLRMNDIKVFYFNIFSSKQAPVILSVQPTSPNRTFGLSGGYLHNILGQDAWKDYVYAGIGVKNNKLIITDKNGNQTPGQTPSVLIPPFTLASNGRYILNEDFEVKGLWSESFNVDDDLYIGSPTNKAYVQQSMNYTNSTFDIRGIKLNDGGSPTFSFYKFRIGEGFGGTVATLNDLDNKLDVITYDENKLVFDDNDQAPLPADLKALIKPYFDNNKPFVLILYNDTTITTYYLKGMRITTDNEITFISFDGDVDSAYTILYFDMTSNDISVRFINIAEHEDTLQYQPDVAKAVYTNNENKQQSMVPYSLLPGDSNIAQFDTNGHLYTNDPSIETHCTNKKYVDNLYFEHIITVKGDTAYALIKKISKTKTAITSNAEMITLLGLQADEIYPCNSGFTKDSFAISCVKYDGTELGIGYIRPDGAFQIIDVANFVSDLVKPL